MNGSNPYFDSTQPFTQVQGQLPHRFQNGKMIFVTRRLYDAMPVEWRLQYAENRSIFIATHPEPWSEETWKEYNNNFSSRFQNYLDNGNGSCVFKNPRVRKILEEALLFYDEDEIYLHAYVIMPNHFHALLEVFDAEKGLDIINSITRFSAKKINELLSIKGRLWAHEPYDTVIRNEAHHHNVLNYIWNNPRDLAPGTFTLGGRAF